MKKFLDKNINERELFSVSLKTPLFEALYLTAVIVLPEYRKKGIGSSLLEKQIGYFKDTYGINNFYALFLSEGGKKMVESVERKMEIQVAAVSRV